MGSAERNWGREAIVIPAYNEEATIGSVVEECKRTLLPVFVVDDGSLDNTTECAIKAGAISLRQDLNGGVGSALRLGIKEAVEKGFDAIVTMDGDGAHDPRFVIKLLERLRRAEADLVLGSRFCNRRWAKDVPSAKRAANYFATSLVNSLTARTFTDVSTGMRALGPRALELQLTGSDFGFVYEMITSAGRAGLAIREEEIRVRYNALEPMCTSRRELLDFITFAVACEGCSLAMRDRLERLKEQVERFCLICVRVGKKHIVLLPVEEYESYAFQFQADWFVTQLKTQWMEIEQ